MEPLGNLSNLEQKSRLEKTLRNRWFWLLVIIVAWLISAIWLGGFIIAIPHIIYFWPRGLIWCLGFFSATLFKFFKDYIYISITINILSIIFLVYFLKNIKIFSKNKIFIFSFLLMLIITLTLVGCSQTFGGITGGL
jgi:hypothetical protein